MGLCKEGQQIVVGNNGDIAVLALHVLHCDEDGCLEKYLELKKTMKEIKNVHNEIKPRKGLSWPIRG